MINWIRKSKDEWGKILMPEQYSVMRDKQTERPFTCDITVKNEPLNAYNLEKSVALETLAAGKDD